MAEGLELTPVSFADASLRAAGWRVVAERKPVPGSSRPSRPRKDNGTGNVQRTLWEAS